MDIMEVEGTPKAKRGKRSGSKRLLGCPECGKRKTVRNDQKQYKCTCGAIFDDILIPVLDNGVHLIELDPPDKLREKVLNGIKDLAVH
jgi:nicotinate phosphoribosyltransferase